MSTPPGPAPAAATAGRPCRETISRQRRGGEAAGGRARPWRPYLAARRRSRSGSRAKTRTSTESGRSGRAAIAAVATTNSGAALETPLPRGCPGGTARVGAAPAGTRSSAGLGTSLFNPLPYLQHPHGASSFLRVEHRCLIQCRPSHGASRPRFSSCPVFLGTAPLDVSWRTRSGLALTIPGPVALPDMLFLTPF